MPVSRGRRKSRLARRAAIAGFNSGSPGSASGPTFPGYGLAILLFLAGWLALTSPWLLGTLTIPYDAKAHFYAQFRFLAEALHSGQSPFWTSNVFAGSPQIADPQSLIFSPAFLLAYFVRDPSFTLLDAYAFALLGSGAVAIVMLFKDKAWHPFGALIAAFAFAFGASASWRIQHIGEIQSFALFGVTLWLLARAIARRSKAWSVVAGASAGVMLLEPDQVALLSSYVLAFFAINEALQNSPTWSDLKRFVPTMAIIGSVALAIAAVPIALAYLFVESSTRPEISFSEAVHGSLHPASLLTSLIGDLYGALDPKVDYWGPYSMAWDPTELTLSQNMSQIYVGSLPIVLLFSLGMSRRYGWARDIRFFTVALAVMIVYALGRYTPVFWIFYKAVPGVHLFRRPADATFMIGGLLAIVGGYLAHRAIVDRKLILSRLTLRNSAAAVALLVVIGLLIALMQGHFRDALKPTAMAAFYLTIAALLGMGLRRFGQTHMRACLAAGALLMSADLYLNNGPNASTALPLSEYEFMKKDCKNETIRFLKSNLRRGAGTDYRDRVELVGVGFSWPNVGMIHGFDHLLGYNPLRMDVTSRAVGAGETIAGWNQRTFTPLFPSYRSLLADMLGLRYVVTPVPVSTIDKRLKVGDLRQVMRTRDGYIYENPNALPRAMFVPNWQLADFETLIATGAWPQFDPRRTLLLEKPPAHFGAASAASAAPAKQAKTTIVHLENTRIAVEVDAPTNGFLLYNSVWHPWWRATVDGVPADIMKANVLFRAVQVTSGRHLVQFDFEPFAGAISEIGSYEPGRAHHIAQRQAVSSRSD